MNIVFKIKGYKRIIKNHHTEFSADFAKNVLRKDISNQNIIKLTF